MTFPILVLAVLAAIGGLMNLPFTSMRVARQVARVVVPRRARGAPRHLHRRIRPGDAHVRDRRSCGIFLAYTLYKKGLEHADRDPLNEKLGRLAPVLGNAYYYDEGVSRLVGGPGRAVASWLDRVVDTKIIDGAVNGVGSLFGSSSRGVQQLQDGRVRRYALGITVGTAAALLYVVIWLGR